MLRRPVSMRALALLVTFAAATAVRATAQGVIYVQPSETVFEPELELKVPLDSLVELVRREPLDAVAHQALGAALLIKKRPEEAERAFRRAIAIDPRFAEAWFGLSVVPYSRLRVELRSTRLGEAREAWSRASAEGASAARRAHRIDPLVDRRLYWLMRPHLTGQVLRNTSKGMVALVRGQEQLRRGDCEAAYQAFDEAVRRDPRQRAKGEGSPYIGLRAEAALCAGRLTEAIADTRITLQRILARGDSAQTGDSGANEVRYQLAALLQRVGKTDEAMALFQEVLARDLSFDLAHVRMADMHEAAGRTDEAVLARRRAVATNPEDPTSLLELGMTLGRAGQLEEARDALRGARKANPDDARALFALGQTYYVLGEEEEAGIQLRHFLELAPSRLVALRREATQLLAELP